MSLNTHADNAYDLNWLISVDDHILEPPNLWVDRVAAKDRDRAPHMEVDDGGMDEIGRASCRERVCLYV